MICLLHSLAPFCLNHDKTVSISRRAHRSRHFSRIGASVLFAPQTDYGKTIRSNKSLLLPDLCRILNWYIGFYNQRRSQLLSDTVSPNAAHQALADFERQWSGEFLLVTQNIDDLHERSGSKQLIHIHGELLKLRCAATDQIYDWQTDSSPQSVCDCCQQTDNLRPHVVWFGEMPLEIERIQTSLQQCDLFIAIGTSGHVYPAAGFVQLASQAGAHTVELNLEPSLVGSQFAEQHYGPATKVVPNFLQNLV